MIILTSQRRYENFIRTIGKKRIHEKIRQNVECEIFGECVEEAKEAYTEMVVREIKRGGRGDGKAVAFIVKKL